MDIVIMMFITALETLTKTLSVLPGFPSLWYTKWAEQCLRPETSLEPSAVHSALGT